jgi:mediator of RNA polymerase II transcription subunit 27
VFRRITNGANAAMLNFQSAVYPELSVRSYLTYLHSFANVFSDTCKACGKHLQANVPPTWREFKTLESFHDDCKP